MKFEVTNFTLDEEEFCKLNELISRIKENIKEQKKEKDKKEEERMFYSNGWNDFGFAITKHILSIDSNFPQNIDELIVRLGLMSYREIIETKDSL